MLTAEQVQRGCTCQVSACDFCTDMDEKEAYAYSNHGMPGLIAYRKHWFALEESLRGQGMISEEDRVSPDEPPDTLTMYASDGMPVTVRHTYAGVATGYGLLGLSPDGDWGVDAAEAGDEGALPVADAYQRLFQLQEDEIYEIARTEYANIEEVGEPEIWGTKEEWIARYPARTVARVLAEAEAALGDPCPLTVNLIAQALVRAGVQA